MKIKYISIYSLPKPSIKIDPWSNTNTLHSPISLQSPEVARRDSWSFSALERVHSWWYTWREKHHRIVGMCGLHNQRSSLVIYKLGGQNQLRFCSIWTSYKLTFLMNFTCKFVQRFLISRRDFLSWSYLLLFPLLVLT